MTITRGDVLGGEPRIDGTRIGVRHVTTRVIEEGQTLPAVADQCDLSRSAVYDALSYYYNLIAEMREHECENDDAFEAIRETSLKPKETAQ